MPGGQERFGHDQLALEHVSWRGLRRTGDVGSDGERGAVLVLSQRESGLEHLERPLIPAAGLGAVLAVRLASFLQTTADGLVLATCEVDLRQGVEHRTGRLAHELQGTSHVEGAVQRFLRTFEIPQPDAYLPERRQGDTKPVGGAALFLELHAPFRQAEGLLVTMLHQGDVRLVAAHGREDIPGLDDHRQSLRLSQRCHRLVEPSLLREGHA